MHVVLYAELGGVSGGNSDRSLEFENYLFAFMWDEVASYLGGRLSVIWVSDR